ncbi:MAG: caspase family protein [Lewinellaceae bacterium]|nr:caspase family protein [Phaeodactylibacter sp.]MCB9351665.1 caspase family protein [Lewinellaceae bacterium]
MKKKQFLLFLFFLPLCALAQQPTLVVPIGQFGPIVKVDFSLDGQNVLTGSEDGTAKLWDLNGHGLQTFGRKKEGKILWTGFSPDGRGVLTRIERNGEMKLRGLDGAVIDSFETGTPNAYVSLSPDCSCSQPIFDTPHLLALKSEIMLYAWNLKEKSYTPNNFLDEVIGRFIALTPFCSKGPEPDGNRQLVLLRSEFDGAMQLVDDRGRVADTLPIYDANALAFSPDARNILFGEVLDLDYNNFDVMLWDMDTRALRPLEGAVLPRRGFSKPFSPDGKYFITPTGDGIAVLWNRKGEMVFSFGPASHGLLSAVFSPKGEYVLMGFENGTAKLFDLKGNVRAIYRNPANTANEIALAADCMPSVSALDKSPYLAIRGDGDVVNLWDLIQGKASSHDSLASCSHWTEQVRIPVYGRELRGTADTTTWLFTSNGTGMIQCSSQRSGDEIASLIVVDSSDWVVTSPSGLFDASPGAMQLLHYVIYYDNTYEIIELEQLKERYYEPGLLQKLMGYSDDPIRSVEGFDTIALYPMVSLQLDTQTQQLRIELTPRNGGLGKVSVFVNGKEIIEDLNPPQGFERKRAASLNVNLAQYSRYFFQDSLNTVSVRAYNAAGWLKSPAHTVACLLRFARAKGGAGDSPPALSFQTTRGPALYAVMIGTANYAGDKLDLKYPDKDAEAMANAIQQAGSQLFGADSVVVLLFTTEAADPAQRPSKANIKQAFETIKARAKAEDVLLVYLSGHGVTYGEADRAQFHYLTQDISSEDLSDEGVRTQRTISTAELTKWINDIPAQKQVMILDACNSGKVVETLDIGARSLNSSQVRALDRMKDRTGMFVLAGSAADKVSYEASQYGQGLLTYSLLQGMSGFKLRDGKYIDIAPLFEYARDEVPKLAESIGGIQTPTMLTPPSGSIDIGILKPGQIHLSPKKPVFIRNYLIDSTSLFDYLELTRQLEEQFQKISAKGATAGLIYVDIPQFPNAYSIRGLYRVEGERVVGRARLFQGEKGMGEFLIQGDKGHPEELVDKIMQDAIKILQKQ